MDFGAVLVVLQVQYQRWFSVMSTCEAVRVYKSVYLQEEALLQSMPNNYVLSLYDRSTLYLAFLHHTWRILQFLLKSQFQSFRLIHRLNMTTKHNRSEIVRNIFLVINNKYCDFYWLHKKYLFRTYITSFADSLMVHPFLDIRSDCTTFAAY